MFRDFLGKMECKTQCLFCSLNDFLVTKNRTHQTGEWLMICTHPTLGPPLILGKKEDMTEGRKAGRASKPKPDFHLSSKSGSATDHISIN